jgi:hypothetical protein
MEVSTHQVKLPYEATKLQEGQDTLNAHNTANSIAQHTHSTARRTQHGTVASMAQAGATTPHYVTFLTTTANAGNRSDRMCLVSIT